MSKPPRQISVKLPASLLEKLGNDPAKKIVALVEKYVEKGNDSLSETSSPRSVK